MISARLDVCTPKDLTVPAASHQNIHDGPLVCFIAMIFSRAVLSPFALSSLLAPAAPSFCVSRIMSATNGTAYGYDCAILSRFPLEGQEVLIFASLFLVLIVAWSIVYADVVVKQWAPKKFLDPSVLARVEQIQKSLPNLALSDAEKEHLYESDATNGVVVADPHYARLEDGTPVEYDAIRAAEAYISGKTIDLDLLVVLANNSAYCTMSQYSAAATRGYSMLATTLSGTAFCTTFP